MVKLTLPAIIPLEKTLKLYHLDFSQSINKTFLFSFKSEKREPLGRESLKTNQWKNWRYYFP